MLLVFWKTKGHRNLRSGDFQKQSTGTEKTAGTGTRCWLRELVIDWTRKENEGKDKTWMRMKNIRSNDSGMMSEGWSFDDTRGWEQGADPT